MKKFTKKDLINKLGYSQEEAKLIMEAQKMFPELLTEEKCFIIQSLRDLYIKLGINKSHWSRWLKMNVKENEFFKENRDWWGFTMMANGNEVEDFKVTIEFAKHLCMTVKNKNGHLIRSYFILMEDAVKKMSDWIIIREPQKDGFKNMCAALDRDYKETHNGEKPNSFLYSNNADMLNLCLLGMKSKKAKEILEVKYNEPLRDNLTQEYNRALYMIQEFNSGLLASHIDYQTRKNLVQNMCNVNYANLKERICVEFAKEIENGKNN